jgi:hypothetical protein
LGELLAIGEPAAPGTGNRELGTSSKRRPSSSAPRARPDTLGQRQGTRTAPAVRPASGPAPSASSTRGTRPR